MQTLEEAKVGHHKVVVIDLDFKGEVRTLAFKPLNRAKITDLKKQITKSPDLALELSVRACEFCCIFGKEHFEELATLCPLAFAGNAENPGVIDALMDLARGGATIRTE